jgi:hypothetical protein
METTSRETILSVKSEGEDKSKTEPDVKQQGGPDSS